MVSIEIILIIDLQLPGFTDGKLFDSKHATLPGLEWFPILHDEALKNGIKCLTPDQFIKEPDKYSEMLKLGMSYEGIKQTIAFFSNYNINKFIVWSGESPINAKKFYKNLDNRIQGFEHIFAFSGVKNLIKKSNINFHNLYWPNTQSFQEGNTWEDRYLIAFMSSPKAKASANFNNILSRSIRYPRYYFNIFLDMFGPDLLCQDMTQYRRDAIKYFAPFSDFHLFGRGWDAAIKYDSFFSKIEFKNLPKPLYLKSSEINKSKFTFCFENTLFPGYITEKIFDAMLGGSVPVWRGCDELREIVPTNCFIDAKEFDNFTELNSFLNSMAQKTWMGYINNIIEYLNGENYMKFKGEEFVKQIIFLINNKKL